METIESIQKLISGLSFTVAPDGVLVFTNANHLYLAEATLSNNGFACSTMITNDAFYLYVE
jgi:hypothetical protein